uniref:Uncharacterized protein n=1 Tax=Vombatus ursinus TaxID=29139 RepID=A0A4X2K3T6_VOMUR
MEKLVLQAWVAFQTCPLQPLSFHLQQLWALQRKVQEYQKEILTVLTQNLHRSEFNT